MRGQQTDATCHVRDPIVSTLWRPPPRQPANEAGDERLIDLGGCDPLQIEPRTEDRRGSDVTSHDAGLVPARREDVERRVSRRPQG